MFLVKYVLQFSFQKKKADEQYLQYCNFCEGFKAPRSHHCRKCNRYLDYTINQLY